MNRPPSQNEAAPEIVLRTWHYQAWCGLCLALVFMGQLAQGILLTNLLAVLLGALGLVSRLRWGSFFLLIGVGLAQSLHFFLVERFTRGWGAGRDLDLHDFLIALGVLGYGAGQYRLQGLWHHLWPPDPRERSGKPRPTFPWLRNRPPVVRHHRLERHLRPAEMIGLALGVPITVLAGMVLFAVTRPSRGWLALPWGLGHFLLLFWALLLGVWMVRHVLDLWHVWSLKPMEARMFLQDQLWAQTRGELRRIARWKAWRKVEERAKAVERTD